MASASLKFTYFPDSAQGQKAAGGLQLAGSWLIWNKALA